MAQEHTAGSLHLVIGAPGVGKAHFIKRRWGDRSLIVDLSTCPTEEDAIGLILEALHAPRQPTTLAQVSAWLAQHEVEALALVHATHLHAAMARWASTLKGQTTLIFSCGAGLTLEGAQLHEVSHDEEAFDEILEAQLASSALRRDDAALVSKLERASARLPLASRQWSLKLSMLGAQGLSQLLADPAQACALLKLPTPEGAALSLSLERALFALEPSARAWWCALCVFEHRFSFVMAMQVTQGLEAGALAFSWIERLEQLGLLMRHHHHDEVHFEVPAPLRLLGWEALSASQRLELVDARMAFFVVKCEAYAGPLLAQDVQAQAWIAQYHEQLLALYEQAKHLPSQAGVQQSELFSLAQVLFPYGLMTSELMPVDEHELMLSRLSDEAHLERAWPLCFRMFTGLVEHGRLDLAHKYAELFTQKALSQGDVESYVKVLGVLANAHRFRGELARAASIWESCVEALSPERHALLLARLRMNLGVLYMDQSDLERAYPCFEFSRAVFEQLDVKRSLGFVHYNLSVYHRDLGHAQEALEHAERALHHRLSFGNDLQIIDARFNLLYLRLGARFLWGDAATQLEADTLKLREHADALGFNHEVAQLDLQRGDLLIDCGELIRARHALETAFQGLSAQDCLRFTISRLLARIDVCQGDHQSALHRLAQCYDRFDALQLFKDAALAAGQLCVVWAQLGRAQESERWRQLALAKRPQDPRHVYFLAVEALSAQAKLLRGEMERSEAMSLAATLLLPHNDGHKAGSFFCSVDLRMAAHGLLEQLEPKSLRQLWVQAVDPKAQALVVSEDAAWFRAPGTSKWDSLEDHPTLAKTLRALLDGRARGCSMQELLFAVYQEDAAHLLTSRAGSNRIYKSLSLLRSRGLQGCFSQRERLYVWDVPVKVVPSV